MTHTPSPTTRLAPSPTGALHLGNARTFLVNWLLARQNNWRVILRIEDIDGPRVKKGADREAIDDLQWLGIDWDEGPIYQSQRLDCYRAALKKLLASKHAYYCTCTRKEVDAAASAPHAEDGAVVYPGTCRDRYATADEARRDAGGREPAVRFDTRGQEVDFLDYFGEAHVRFDVEHQLGDFVIAKGDGTPAYQLAVVVDDADMGVTDVVRGHDLLDSTPRQALVYRALGLADRIPAPWHLPLVIGPDGRRLAKRHGDTRLATYRKQGVPAGRVLALLARWCGFVGDFDYINVPQLLERFSMARMPRERIVMLPAHDEWLRRVAFA
jgi:glutamyl-tRNA synthetase